MRGRAGSATRKKRASGVATAQLLLGMVILGLLGGLATPRLKRALLMARTREAYEALETARQALTDYHAERGRWPEDAGPGRIPDGLESRLPESFAFQGKRYALDYDRFGGPSDGLVVLTVETESVQATRALLSFLGDAPAWTDGHTHLSRVVEWGSIGR